MAESNNPEPESQSPKKQLPGMQSLKDQLEKLKKPSKKWLWILIGVVVAAVVIAIVVVAVYSNTKEPSITVTTQTAASTSTTMAATTTSEMPQTTTTVVVENISDGTYLVGTDIPAGVYKGTVTGGSGYWQISTDANGLDIIASETVSAQFYLEVEEGQFLKLSHVTISQ